MSIALITGLGNPGTKHEGNRHNVGFWFCEELARRHGQHFRPENRFHGEVARITEHGRDIWLLKPDTYMNRSGQAVRALASFYKIPVQQILVVHDELDVQPGAVKLKKGGGHGGHNGLRDIVAHMGNDFARIRIGIGHPGQASDVSNYVLHDPSTDDRILMERVIEECLHYLPDLLDDHWSRAMNHLHSLKLGV